MHKLQIVWFKLNHQNELLVYLVTVDLLFLHFCFFFFLKTTPLLEKLILVYRVETKKITVYCNFAKHKKQAKSSVQSHKFLVLVIFFKYFCDVFTHICFKFWSNAKYIKSNFINNWRIYLSLETALSMRSNLASDNFVHDIMYS